MSLNVLLVTIAVSLAVGNGAWAALTSTTAETAIERTYFQCVALFIVWLLS